MRIFLLVSSKEHPIIPMLNEWKKNNSLGKQIKIINHKKDLVKGDILFLISCNEILNSSEIKKFKKVFVLHASDLPKGRGWSPHIHSILNNKNEITVSLIEANKEVDKGDIWLKDKFKLEGHELFNEINEILFRTELKLMSKLINNIEQIIPIKQSGNPGKYNKKRTPKDSELNPNKSIASQFNLLRISDPKRFPAFIKLNNHKYLINIEKIDDK